MNLQLDFKCLPIKLVHKSTTLYNVYNIFIEFKQHKKKTIERDNK